MAITFVGYYRPAAGSPTADQIENARSGTGGVGGSTPFQEKVRGFPASLPDTCKLIGSWAPSGGEVPGVMVLEVESFGDLQHINQYYNGWLAFDWHPVLSGGVART